MTESTSIHKRFVMQSHHRKMLILDLNADLPVVRARLGPFPSGFQCPCSRSTVWSAGSQSLPVSAASVHPGGPSLSCNPAPAHAPYTDGPAQHPDTQRRIKWSNYNRLRIEKDEDCQSLDDIRPRLSEPLLWVWPLRLLPLRVYEPPRL